MGVPSQLLERRPDIAAAERAVAQANAQIGIAKTAFFPTVTLSASAGFQSLSIAKWLDMAEPGLVRRPGSGARRFSMRDCAGPRSSSIQASYDQTVANYRQTVLTAFQQVEDNLAALRILAQVIEQQDAAIESAGRNLQEAEVRYKAGLDPYLNVITAQTASADRPASRREFSSAANGGSVQLIKALGGGWDASQIPSPKELGARISAGQP